jgi:hypothetical protein
MTSEEEPTSAGLQLSYSQVDITKGLVVDDMPDTHILSFDFDVLPALHVETTSEVLSAIQLAATIFSLIASATKLLSTLKRKISHGTDMALLKRDDVPEDVQRRTDYLDETNLLHRHFKKMMHHHGIASQREEGRPNRPDSIAVDVNNKRLTALSVMKQKRISSSMVSGTGGVATGDIEMATLHSPPKKTTSAVFTNPLKNESKEEATKEMEKKQEKEEEKEEKEEMTKLLNVVEEKPSEESSGESITVQVVEAVKENTKVTGSVVKEVALASTEKTIIEKQNAKIADLEEQNYELLIRLEALEQMIVPTEAELKAAPQSSMLAASMKNVLSAVS